MSGARLYDSILNLDVNDPESCGGREEGLGLPLHKEGCPEQAQGRNPVSVGGMHGRPGAGVGDL